MQFRLNSFQFQITKFLEETVKIIGVIIVDDDNVKDVFHINTKKFYSVKISDS